MGDGYDVIVVGIGVIGAAAAYELARRNLKVLAIDRYGIPNQMGCSHGETRIFRVSYYEHPDYVPLLTRSRKRWLELEQEAGVKLLHQTGGLWMGSPNGMLVGETQSAAVKHNLKHEVLSPEEIKTRWPDFVVSEKHVGFFEEDAGTLLPEHSVETFTNLAKDAGAKINTNEQVIKWSADSAGVIVNTDKGVYNADKLVLCAGPWSSSLLKNIGIDLPITRATAVWFDTKDKNRFKPPHFPCWAVERDAYSFYYGFPCISELGTKTAIHAAGDMVDPETLDRNARDEEVAELDEMIQRVLPGTHGVVSKASVCMYTNTADGHFVLDRHPQCENVIIGCGFCGHGFKFAPVIGEILADLSVKGFTNLPAQFLSLSRFQAENDC